MFKSLEFTGSDLFIDATDLTPDLLDALIDCGAPGPADAAVAYVRENFDVKGDPAACAAMLKGYGAWEDDELADHDANLDRLVWLTGCSLAEDEPAYFFAY